MNGPELVVGGFLGAFASEGLKVLIEEAKRVSAFKSVSKELTSTMESILPIVEQIESMMLLMMCDPAELKFLKDTIDDAFVIVLKCSGVKRWNLPSKAKYTRKIEEINWKMLKFCQIKLQLILLRNQQLSLQNQQLLLMDQPLVPINKLLPVATVETIKDHLQFIKKLLIQRLSGDNENRSFMEVKKKLLDDAVDMLLVSAPPGYGKTTLAKLLCEDEEIKGKFKHIFFSVVSSSPNFRVMVQNMLLHNGYRAHTIENDYQAVVGLRKLLEKLREDGPILLVLDDVWPGAESLLQKFRIKLPDYKILVTSRFEFPSFDSFYHLKPLEDNSARRFLIMWASRPFNASTEEYEELLKKILRRCNGIPLVIKEVGSSLRGKSLTSWKSQVERWSKGGTILDESLPNVLNLQRSFNALDSNLKECFLNMGLFLEDQEIRASSIIDIGVGLYGKGSGDMCMKYLEDLDNQNLLKLALLKPDMYMTNQHEDGFYNDFLVTQHNILREFAICQSESEEIQERKRLNLEIKEDKFPDWCLNIRQPIINARLLSISTDDSFSSKWIDMEFPNVEVLILHTFSSDYALPSFISKMTKLKVLIITNHGSSSHAKLSNFSCLSSLPNLKRIRLEKASVTLLDLPQLRLRSLEKLSLFKCDFGEVFYDAEAIDISVALPSLQEIDIDDCDDLVELPYWISEVVSLKTLSITNCIKLRSLPEEIGNLSNLEVLRLRFCISLSELPETSAGLCNLRFLDISSCMELRKLPLEIGNLQKLKKISMRNCPRCELPDSVRYLEDLEVKCDGTTGFLWERLKPKMRNLTVHEEEIENDLPSFVLSCLSEPFS